MWRTHSQEIQMHSPRVGKTNCGQWLQNWMEKDKEGMVCVKQEPGVPGTSEQVIVTAILPSDDPDVINFQNTIDKEGPEGDEDIEVIELDSSLDELDRDEVVDILQEMAQLKQNEADLYTRLIRAAPDMSDNDMIVSVEHTPKPTSSLPDCVHKIYNQINDPYSFRLALAAGERMLNLLQAKQEDKKVDSMEKTCHYFEVSTKNVYEVSQGRKILQENCCKMRDKD